MTHILIAVALSTLIFWVIEMQKWVLRAWERREKGGAVERA